MKPEHFGKITYHLNSILNPDPEVIESFLKDDKGNLYLTSMRAVRARSLLPNVEKYFAQEYNRALEAVKIWEKKATEQILNSIEVKSNT